MTQPLVGDSSPFKEKILAWGASWRYGVSLLLLVMLSVSQCRIFSRGNYSHVTFNRRWTDTA